MDAVTNVPPPVNEPVLNYAPGSPERTELEARLKQMAAEQVELTMAVGGEHRLAGGEPIDVVQPHRRQTKLGTLANATSDDVRQAIDASATAADSWQHMSFDDRAAIFLKAADLLSGPWRATLNAATMLGQSKTAYQAEIDSACEMADFWRFNVAFARQILEEQPISSPGVWNRLDHRPLEGFVLAITPFNFTAIAGNLPTAPALMGNTAVWKPAVTQQLAAHFTMQLLEAAGLPPGVINMVTGRGEAISEVAVPDPALAGIHFTGSTAVFGHLWDSVARNLRTYRAYPRLVGETGGKDFVVAHPSADLDVLRVALIRGAFEYQGQKCSAASRAYIPRSLWSQLRDALVEEVQELTMGDVTDFRNFMGAVIDDRSFAKLSSVLDRVRGEDGVEIVAGGAADDKEGYFVRPTIVVADDPDHEVFTTEYFGPNRGVRLDRFDHRRRSICHRRGDGRVAFLRRQLLHQRQAHRCSGGSAALRRREGEWHQRQSGFGAQSPPLGIASDDQGNIRAANRLPVPIHGVVACHWGNGARCSGLRRAFPTNGAETYA